MPKFEVEIPHALTAEEARTRLEKARRKLEADYGAVCSWDGTSAMLVKRKGLDARVAIEAARVFVTCELGFLMSAMAGPIKAGITKQLTDLLSRPSDS